MMAWWKVIRSTCSAAPVRTRRARSRGPVSRSKRAPARWAPSRSCSVSRWAGGRPARAPPGRETAGAGSLLCTGPFATGPVQRIDPAPAVSLPCVDLAGLPSAHRETEHERLGAHLAGALFDLETGPLLRALLVRTGAAEHVLRMTFHHAIIDGWSLGVLLRDLAAFYRARHEGVPAGLSELPVQYA